MTTFFPASSLLRLHCKACLPLVRKWHVTSPATTRSLAAAAAVAGSNNSQHLVVPLPRQYLRDADLRNYSPATLQRNDARFDASNGKPTVESDESEFESRYRIDSCRLGDEEEWEIKWGDGMTSTYPKQWVEEQKALIAAGSSVTRTPDTTVNGVNRMPWSNISEADVRAPDSTMSLSFRDIVHDDEGGADAVKVMYRYGLLLVTETPVDDGGAGVAAFASAVSGGTAKTSPTTSLVARYRAASKADSHPENAVTVLPNGTDGPLRTLYGNVWSTHSSGMAEGASVADSAYGSDGLPLHTDMTYHRDPPGVQVFTMIKQAIEGGESVFADGFAIAERLRSDDPDAFNTLCRYDRRFRCIDKETGWHLEGRGPVIAAVDRGHNASESSRWGPVTAIRHNDLDRLPDLPPPTIMSVKEDTTREKLVDEYYSELRHAHRQWDKLLGSDEFRLVLNLRPGDTVAVANQRCFHGRFGFRASQKLPRAVMGCYISQDDLDSRFRRAGFHLF